MSAVFEVDPSRPGQAIEAIKAIEAATIALRAGGLVILPTETVYGIASRPDDPGATARLFEAKRRPAGLNLPVLAASVHEAWDLAVANQAAGRLAAALWPGPLTMVLPRGDRSRDWALGRETGTIGLRVPDHALTLALLERSGPLAATSANISGVPPLAGRAALQEAFGEAVAVYVVAPKGAPAPSGRSSTVVDLTGEEPRVLREGPIDASRIAALLHSVH